MAYDLTKDRLDPSDDPKSIAEFIAEPSEVTQRRMRERQEDREEREREHLPVAPRQIASPVMELERALAERLVAWYQGGAKVHPSKVAAEMIEDMRRANWREPPRAPSASGEMPIEEWKRRREGQLDPARVSAHADAARKAIQSAREQRHGTGGSLGIGTGTPQQTEAATPVTETPKP